HRMRLAMLQEKLRYDLYTHGTATSPYALSDAQIVAQDAPAIRAEREYLREQGTTGNWGLLKLALFGALLAWLLLSSKVQRFAHNFVEGVPSRSEAHGNDQL